MINKTVLITGASRGIGAAIAEEFARHGHRLILNSCHSADTLHALCDHLTKTYGVSCKACVGDVGDHAFVKKMFEKIEQEYQGIDILVNNAGISHIGLLSDMDITQWDHILATNLTSVFSCCKYAIPHMVRQQAGAILNISSVWGNVGASCEVAYSATKGGINSFTKALAKELAPSKISVNAIACGVIDTQMNACFDPQERSALEDEIPAGRYGTPEEVASLAYALTTQSSYLTAQIVTLDGGWI